MSTMTNRRCPDQIRAASERTPPLLPQPGTLHELGRARGGDGARDGARGIALKPYLLCQVDDPHEEQSADLTLTKNKPPTLGAPLTMVQT
jgi:hypothetical protein